MSVILRELSNYSPEDLIIYFIMERESIRIKKERNEPKPWTDNPILRQYRFCNIRRMDDKVSKWLMENWYTDDQVLPPLTAALLARHINKIETLERLDRSYGWHPSRLKKELRSIHKPFGSAYVISGALGKYKNYVDKIAIIVNGVIDPIHRKAVPLKVKSIEDSVNQLVEFDGMGYFMAGQTVADLRWVLSPNDPHCWRDRMTWAAKGPGSCRGMCRYLGKTPKKSAFSQNIFSSLLTEFIEHCSSKLPESITSRLEAIDWQNILCEYDKFCRTLYGEGSPKRRYR